MPEPALTIAKERLTHEEIDAEGVDLGKGLAADLVHEDPVHDEWGYVIKHTPMVVITKNEKPIARFWKGTLWIVRDHYTDRQLTTMLNQLRLHYYGWPVSFKLVQTNGSREIHYFCRDGLRQINKHSTPVRF